MKKYFIFAVAAMAAMAACSKVNVVDNTPDKKISFEVANYARQTKANKSLSSDNIYEFHTYAYQFPALGNAVVFMDEDIFPWKSSTHTDANKLTENLTGIAEWAPTDDYFWPKTGTINFYSYAGTDGPDEATAVAAADANLTTITFTYTDATIDANSNILVADPAIGQTRDNSNTATYTVDASTNVTNGVATLFHHMLTKVEFDVKLKTATTNSNIWKVTVLDEFDNDHKSQLIAKNQGTLTLTSTVGTNNGAWSPSIATAASASSNAVLWVPTTSTEAITLESDEMTLAANAETSGDAVELLALRSVMPQLSTGVQLQLTYKVQAFHANANDPYLEEIRTVGIGANANDAKYLSDLVNSSVINWLPNKKITYHIVIDPVTEKVTFDPAVEDYSEVVGNENYNIDINEGGIIVPNNP